MGLVAGVSATLSQEPYKFWPLVLVAFFCFIYLLDSFCTYQDNRHRYAFCLGWGIYAIWMCNWISFFGPIALIAFLFAESFFAYIFVTLTAKLKRYLPRSLHYAICWVLFEWIIGNIPILSFTWLSFSTTLINTPAAFLSRVGGGALLTFVAVFFSAQAAIYVRNTRAKMESQTKKSFFYRFSFALVLTIILIVLSSVHLGEEVQTKTVSVVQGNDKNRYLTQEEIDSDYLLNSHLDLANSISNKRDFIIFPESAFQDDPEQDLELKSSLKPIAAKTKSMVILNTIASEDDQDFNRNYFYSPGMNLYGSYDKKRLVPFGEYVPAESLIGSWSIFEDIGSGFTPGTNDETLNGVTSLICYESTFTNDVKNALTSDSKLLVITTNNRSYRRSGNSAQHLAQSRLRAAEFGIGVVHASVSGSSAIIDRRGNVTNRTELFERKVLSGNVQWGQADSIYSKTGDWLSLVALLVVVCTALIQLRKMRWKSQTSIN